jgi:hypothetical protein
MHELGRGAENENENSITAKRLNKQQQIGQEAVDRSHKSF